MEDAIRARTPDVIGRELATAYFNRSPVSKSWVREVPALADAYAVQNVVVSELVARGAGSPVGYKVGLTSETMQRFAGVNTPIYGRILEGNVKEDGAVLYRHDYLNLGLECELAIRFGSDVPVDDDLSDEDLLGYIASVHAAFEIIDDRGADYTSLTAPEIIAENSWNAGIVVGPGRSPSAFGQLDAIGGNFFQNAVNAGSGNSSDVLGGPLHVVQWLRRFLAGHGLGLRASDWVMTGSIVTTRFPENGSRYRFELEGLPPVSLTVLA